MIRQYRQTARGCVCSTRLTRSTSSVAAGSVRDWQRANLCGSRPGRIRLPVTGDAGLHGPATSRRWSIPASSRGRVGVLPKATSAHKHRCVVAGQTRSGTASTATSTGNMTTPMPLPMVPSTADMVPRPGRFPRRPGCCRASAAPNAAAWARGPGFDGSFYRLYLRPALLTFTPNFTPASPSLLTGLDARFPKRPAL